MLDKPTASHTIGLNLDDFSLKGATLNYSKRKIQIDEIFDFFIETEISDTGNVKRFYIEEEKNRLNELTDTHLVITAASNKDVLVRPLDTLLTKNKDINDALHFQVEPILPYSLDQAVLDKIILNKDKEGSKLSVFVLRKDHLVNHLTKWKDLGIDSEIVSAESFALNLFANFFANSQSPSFVVHIGIDNSFCILIDQKKLVASQAIPIGINKIIALYSEQTNQDLKTSYSDFKERKISLNHKLFSEGPLKDLSDNLRLNITRTIYSLAKTYKNKDIDQMMITGPGTLIENLKETFAAALNKKLVKISSKLESTPQDKSFLDILPIDIKNKILNAFSRISDEAYSLKDKFISKYEFLQKYKSSKTKNPITLDDQLLFALPIGEALSGLTNTSDQINFRQDEFTYPEPWKRLKKPLFQYFICLFLVALTTYLFGKAYIHHQEGEVRKDYKELLEVMNKPYQKVENEYQNKIVRNKDASSFESIPLSKLSSKDIENRLLLLEKDLKANPQTFPLQPNAPLAIDTLTWILNQFAIVQKKESGADDEDGFHIETFSYTMVKRPEPLKKQEKYQIKVELEFTSIKPKLAREFHDILITPNDFIDPKAEIKWGSNKDRYRTSFYLKDKTTYPN